ncbi:MAG: 3-phosphoglycerate dehydrogenase [Eubacterium sp.]|jgi:D-3-phosphoglycerate dehydrogenase|nr:3-phosphoglycerate dehydrogenase [Eubacterium sp.]
MFQYICLNPIAQVGLDVLEEGYQKTENINEASAALVRSASMHDMELPETLDVVARAGAGVNNIPLEACAEKGIVVFNTPGANANGVKELVLAGMFLASRDVNGGVNWVESEKDNPELAKMTEKQKKAYAGCEIAGKKLGVIGLGAIGIRVANAATHLDMEVYGYDPYISVNAAWNLSRNVRHVRNVEDIYRECDYITIHVPLLDATRKMINEEAIALMKPDAVILNFARDLLVDEEAVVAALAEGRLKKYVSDFPNQTTAGKKGCLVIPHLGASTEESEDNCAVMAAQEIRNYLENGNIRNSVNYPNCDMGECTTEGRVAVLHKNSKGVIGKFTSIFGECDINIANMTNKSKGDYAYSMFDLDAPMTEEAVLKMKEMKGVFKVRIVK